jgi:hypothetical protein
MPESSNPQTFKRHGEIGNSGAAIRAASAIGDPELTEPCKYYAAQV